jgi:hypothetical protein
MRRHLVRRSLLALLLAGGCASTQPGLETNWAGRRVGEFVDATEMDPERDLVSDGVTGYPIGLKGVTKGGATVTLYFNTPGDWTADREWELNDIADLDITGIQISRKW